MLFNAQKTEFCLLSQCICREINDSLNIHRLQYRQKHSCWVSLVVNINGKSTSLYCYYLYKRWILIPPGQYVLFFNWLMYKNKYFGICILQLFLLDDKRFVLLVVAGKNIVIAYSGSYAKCVLCVLYIEHALKFAFCSHPFVKPILAYLHDIYNNPIHLQMDKIYIGKIRIFNNASIISSWKS